MHFSRVVDKCKRANVKCLQDSVHRKKLLKSVHFDRVTEKNNGRVAFNLRQSVHVGL